MQTNETKKLRLGDDNCGGGINLHTVVTGEDVSVAWTTRCVAGGKELVSDAQAKQNARDIAHRYNVHEDLLAFAAQVARMTTDDESEMASEDAIATLNGLIVAARALTSKARGGK